MSQRSRTKDERYVLRLYELALQSGDMRHVMNRYDVGKSISLHDRACNTICNLLIRANFIKKTDKDNIYLTPQGEKLALRLLEEK